MISSLSVFRSSQCFLYSFLTYKDMPPESRFAVRFLSTLFSWKRENPLTDKSHRSFDHTPVNRIKSLFLNNSVNSFEYNLFVYLVTNPCTFNNEKFNGTLSLMSYNFVYVSCSRDPVPLLPTPVFIFWVPDEWLVVTVIVENVVVVQAIVLAMNGRWFPVFSVVYRGMFIWACPLVRSSLFDETTSAYVRTGGGCCCCSWHCNI